MWTRFVPNWDWIHRTSSVSDPSPSNTSALKTQLMGLLPDSSAFSPGMAYLSPFGTAPVLESTEGNLSLGLHLLCVVLRSSVPGSDLGSQLSLVPAGCGRLATRTLVIIIKEMVEPGV